MRVLVKFLGHVRVELRRREVRLELADGARVSDAVSRLVAGLGREAEGVLLDRARGGYNVLFTVNGRPVDASATLSDGDELTVFPPIAGG